MATPAAAGDYYDILLVGSTGMGKSTTANNLLDIVYPSGSEVSDDFYFPVSDGSTSLTSNCKLLCNDEIRARVIDTQGFADSKVTKDDGVFGGNLQIVRSILMCNVTYNLKIRRILYFLPTRGPLTRAGGVLQEEIQVLHGFFGESIFNVMVIIATHDKEDSDSLIFSPNKIDKTTTAFMAAYKVITGKVLPRCPPIIYLPFSESGTLSRVKSAEVIDDKPLKIENRCVKCAAELIYKNKKSEDIEYVIEADTEMIEVEKSKCHPCFVPKYTTLQKIVGTLIIIVTLGIVRAVAKRGKIRSLPGYFNKEEVCIKCNQPPGHEACAQYGEEVEVKCNEGTTSIKTFHSTQMEKYHTYEKQ